MMLVVIFQQIMMIMLFVAVVMMTATLCIDVEYVEVDAVDKDQIDEDHADGDANDEKTTLLLKCDERNKDNHHNDVSNMTVIKVRMPIMIVSVRIRRRQHEDVFNGNKMVYL
jgi:hypothetical protein